MSLGSAPLHHAVGGQRRDGRAGIVGEHARVPCGPARRQLWSVEQWGEHQRRANGTNHLGDVVVLGEILTDQADEGQLFAKINELHCPTADFRRFPSEDVWVEGATEVVLEDLRLVQRPSVVLVLANMKPLFAARTSCCRTFFKHRINADVYPVAR